MQSWFPLQAEGCQGEQQAPMQPQVPGKSYMVMETMFCCSVLFSVSVTTNLHGSAENY